MKNHCPICFETVDYDDWYVNYRNNTTHVECVKAYREWRQTRNLQLLTS